MRWSDCYDCISQHAYAKEPLAELVLCVLQLLGTAPTAGAATAQAESETELLKRTVLSMVRICCAVEVLHSWGDQDAVISTEQKLDVVLPLQEVFMEWFPTLCTLHETADTAEVSASGGDDGERSPARVLSGTDQFWLTESHAMLAICRETLGDTRKVSDQAVPLVGQLSACNMLEPYLTYMQGTENFRAAFGLPAAAAAVIADAVDDDEPPDAGEEPQARGGGRTLRQRRRGNSTPWWVGNKAAASNEKKRRHSRAADQLDGDDSLLARCSHDGEMKIEKAFPSGLYICTEMIRRHVDATALSLSNTGSGVQSRVQEPESLSRVFSQLVRLYIGTSAMHWDEAGGASGEDSDEAASSDDTTTTNAQIRSTAAYRERRGYSEIVREKLLSPIEAVVPKAKRSRLQLHSQQEMCFYKCRVACLQSLTAVVTCAHTCATAATGDLLDLFQCPGLVEARTQAGLESIGAGLGSAALCAVYFSRQLRSDVAAGITPPLLIAYVRWIQCLLEFDGTSAADAGCRRRVAENFQGILSKFEIDAPGIVRTLLQSLLDLSLPHDARDIALRVLGTLLPKKKAGARTAPGGGEELLVSASMQCKHAALRVAIRFLVAEVKATPAEKGETLAEIIDVVTVLVSEPCAATHFPLRPALAGLVQSLIGRAADVGRLLYDMWPVHRGQKAKRKQTDSIDIWPGLYSVIEKCMLQLLPAVRACTWLQGETANGGGGGAESLDTRSPASRQRSHVPRVLQVVEDFDAEVMQLCQLATRDGASAFDAVAGGVARPILKAIKAIQGSVATSARESTAAAAQEAQQQLQGDSRRPRSQPQKAHQPRKKKRKRHTVRSKNSYVDAVLNEEEKGDDAYDDLEDWIVYKRGRKYE